MKIRSQAYIQLGEETLKIVHRTFQPEVPVILNCLETTDYLFTNIEPALIIVKRPAVHQNKSLPQQPASGDTISQQTHPQQPDKTRIYPSMLTNRQVPVLNLTETNITSHTDLQDAFNSLCVCSHGRGEDTEDQSTE